MARYSQGTNLVRGLPGALTPYGQVLDYCYLDAVWARMKKISNFAARLEAVRAFNAANQWKKRGISMIP